MSEFRELEYGIKYRSIKVGDNYLLVPIGLIGGYKVKDSFYSEKKYSLADAFLNLDKNKYVVDDIYSEDELCEYYECDDVNFVLEYFFSEKSDYVVLVQKKKDGIVKRSIDLKMFSSLNPQEQYENDKSKATVTLNDDAIMDLLSSCDIDEIRKKLHRYGKITAEVATNLKKKGISKVVFKNGHVEEIETTKKVKSIEEPSPIINYSNKKNDNEDRDISYLGLVKYLKERVFGHEKEIEILAKQLIFNYYSTPKYGTEPILIIGPTGTGKTATMRAASEYLGVPFIEINSANLIAQGIRGTSIESQLYALLHNCGFDNKIAEKGIIFFDEFDKLGESRLDTKEDVPNILLKFLDGSVFTIERLEGDFTFDTTMTSKVFAGAFEGLFVDRKNIGFSRNEKEGREFDARRIHEEEYYGKQLVTRINHILLYEELDRQTKKRALLESKLSKLRLKKERYEEQFGVSLEATDEYIEAILDLLKEQDRSMRDIDNLIISSLEMAECAILANQGKVKKLILTSETAKNNKDFNLY